MPEEQTKAIKMQLMQYQTQIKVLIHNHKILKQRVLQGSEVSQVQIGQIEEYLIQLSQKQSKAIAKLKEFECRSTSGIDSFELNSENKNNIEKEDTKSNKSPITQDTDSEIPEEDKKIDTEKPKIAQHSEENILDNEDDGSTIENVENSSSSSLGEITRENSVEKDDVDLSSPYDTNEDKKDAVQIEVNNGSHVKDDSKLFPPSNMEPPVSSKLTVKDRMAIVRGMRRYGKRRGGISKPYNSNRSSRKTSPSPCEIGYKNGEQGVSNDLSEEAEEDQMDYMTNGQYKGHVSEIEKLGLDKNMLADKIKSATNYKIEESFFPKETLYPNADKNQYTLNLGLISQESIVTVYEQQSNIREKKREIRNLTYVPETRDKKLRVGYSYVPLDVTSPPMLRNRQGVTNEGVRKSGRYKNVKVLMEEFVSED